MAEGEEMNVIRTARDAAEYAQKIIPDPQWGNRYFHDAARMLFQGAMISLVRLEGETTPQKAKALCSDVGRLRETLERDPEAWPQCREFFAAGCEAPMLCNIRATLHACLDRIPERSGEDGGR